MKIEDIDLLEKLIKAKYHDTSIRVYTHFYNLKDITLIILKGHLLVEAEINEMLNTFLHKPKVLQESNFDFFQRLCVLRSIIDTKYLPEKDWEAIKQLNSLRNKIAHNLQPEGLDNMIRSFLKKSNTDIKKIKEWKEGNNETRLIITISMLCAKLVDVHTDILLIKNEVV